MADENHDDDVDGAKLVGLDEPTERAVPAEPSEHPCRIVAIGASAGGVEALAPLVRALPLDTGMAFVVVQHVARGYKSQLPVVLSMEGRVPVIEMAQGQRLLPNHVYIVPGGMQIVLHGCTLQLEPLPDPRSIDRFFCWLAETYGDRAIAVVLSGASTIDCLEGVRAIKRVGGVVLVQDERTARFPEMPTSVAGAAAADFILDPEGIAAALGSLARDPRLRPRFFRDPPAFRNAMRALISRMGLRAESRRELRVWVPGCAAGEEAYSLAVWLIEYIQDTTGPVSSFRLLASDPSERMVERARAGSYPESIARDVPRELLGRFFAGENGSYRISRGVRDSCLFARHDIYRDPLFSRIDIISVRNLFLYTRPEHQRELLPLLHFALNDGGVLIGIPGQEVPGIEELFSVMDTQRSVYVRRPGKARMPVLPVRRARVGPVERPAPIFVAEERNRFAAKVAAALGHYEPASFALDERLNVVEFRGNVSRYLLPSPGEATLSILRLVPPGLATALRSAVDEAHHARKLVRRQDEQVVLGDEKKLISFHVMPVQATDMSGFLVVVDDCRPAEGEASPAGDVAAVHENFMRASRERDQCIAEIGQLRDRLIDAARDREIWNEELVTANDELASANRLLAKANEEKDAAQEELQIIVDQLNGTNAMLEERNAELARLADDNASMLRSVRLPVVMVDSMMRVRRFTPAAVSMLGIREEDVGQPICDLPLRVRLPNVAERLRKVIGELAHESIEVRDPDGHWFNVQMHPHKTSGGQVDGAVITLIDIDAAKHAEFLLASFAESVVENVPAFVMTMDNERRAQRFCKFARNKTGYSEQEIRGRDITDAIVAREYRESFRRMVDDALAGRHASGTELEISTRDGQRLLIQWFSAEMRDAAGRSAGIVLIGIDVTDLRRKEEQLRHAAKMEAIGRLAGGVAHDFNNYLTGIRGFATLVLADMAPDDPNRELLDQIVKGADRSARLTKQLLALGRRAPLAAQPVNLNNVIDEITEPLHRMMGEDVKLAITKASGLATVSADPGGVQQIITNLAINARDAMPKGGTLTIETANVELDEEFVRQHPHAMCESFLLPAPAVMLSIADTGTGISPEAMQHLFEPFYSTKPAHLGTGLGLATVHGIVEQTGGCITVASELGKGTTFRIYFPRIEAEAAAKPLKLSEGAARGAGETILVVEDEHNVRIYVSRVLEAGGYSVITAGLPSKALEIVRERDHEIDMLVSDVVMPEMNGPELAKKICEARPDLPVLFVSGFPADIIKERGIDPSINLLVKPFSPEDLLKRVRETMKRR